MAGGSGLGNEGRAGVVGHGVARRLGVTMSTKSTSAWCSQDRQVEGFVNRGHFGRQNIHFLGSKRISASGFLSLSSTSTSTAARLSPDFCPST